MCNRFPAVDSAHFIESELINLGADVLNITARGTLSVSYLQVCGKVYVQFQEDPMSYKVNIQVGKENIGVFDLYHNKEDIDSVIYKILQQCVILT